MGKVKQVIMGDEVAEAEAKKKAAEKRAQKKLAKKEEVKEVEEVKKEPKKSLKSSPSMPSRGKKYLAVAPLVDKKKVYSLADALDLVKKTSYSKFDGTVEMHLNVMEKGLRGVVSLPHGTGKKIRVRIADDELIANPVIDFDILVAHPSMMPKLAKIAKILGPRGLMTNHKTNTISENPEELVKKLTGSSSWRTETDFPIVHTIIGKVSFEDKKLTENLSVIVKSIGKDKIKSAFLKPTMGPAVRVAI